MDAAAFLRELPDLYAGGDVRDGALLDERFAEVAQQTVGFTTPKVMALLNLAARRLPPGEAYLEVGTFQGRSLCGAMLGAQSGSFHAVENFLEFGMLGQQARRALHDNLERWTRRELLTLHDGDCFEVLPQLAPGLPPVGVYFYDGAHTSLTHYLALALVEPLLADRALVLVDDSAWPLVRRATEQYLRRRPSWRVLHELRPAADDDPDWANGLMVLEFRRDAAPHGSAPGSAPRDVAWRRQAYLRVEKPVTDGAWTFVHRHPSVVPALKRLVPTRGRRVQPGA